MSTRTFRLGVVVALFATSGGQLFAQGHAQQLRIDVAGALVLGSGGEVTQVFGSALASELSRTRQYAMWADEACHFSVAPRTMMPRNAPHAWVVAITPIQTGDIGLVGPTVTFRLEWRRLGAGDGATAPSRTSEYTLGPGQSAPVDLVPTGATSRSADGCQARALSLRVGVDFEPRAQIDQRLLEAELWLVERSSDGRERSWPLVVRGLPNREVPFFFEPLVDGDWAIDLYGDIALWAEGTEHLARIRLNQRSRRTGAVSNPVRSSLISAPSIRMRAGAVADVTLPPFEAGAAGPLSGRTYSMRLRIRQLQ